MTRGDGAGARSPQPVTRSAAAALICLAVASGAYLLVLQSHLTFVGDDWQFLLKRRGLSVGVFLNPHNDHIAVIPVAIYKGLLAVFGMSSPAPFQVVSTLIFLLSVLLLFIYMCRRVGDWLALLGVTLILFLGAAWTDLLWSFQMGFFGSMAAGIGAFLALDRDDRRGDLLACALLVVATAFSELGIPFAAGAFINIALAPSPRRRRFYVALVPIALYGIWYLGWGHKGAHVENFHNLVGSPEFVFNAISQNLASLFGLATPMHGKLGQNDVGLAWGQALLVIALVLSIWRLRRIGGLSRQLWAVLAAGGTFWFLTALNSIPGLRDATTGRYQYPGAIFVLLIASELLRGTRASKRLLIAGSAGHRSRRPSAAWSCFMTGISRRRSRATPCERGWRRWRSAGGARDPTSRSVFLRLACSPRVSISRQSMRLDPRPSPRLSSREAHAVSWRTGSSPGSRGSISVHPYRHGRATAKC